MLFVCVLFGVELFVFSLPSSAAAASDPLYTIIYKGLIDYQTKIPLGKFGGNKTKVDDTYERVINDHPEIFYIKHSVLYDTQSLFPQYVGSKKQIEKMKIINKKSAGDKIIWVTAFGMIF